MKVYHQMLRCELLASGIANARPFLTKCRKMGHTNLDVDQFIFAGENPWSGLFPSQL